MKRIYIRADGNAHIGLGHLIRTFALSAMLQDHFEFHLLTRGDEKLVRDLAGDICKEITFLKDDLLHALEADHLIETVLQRDDLLILDGYQFDFAYQEKIKSADVALICIDDIHQGKYAADLIINPSGNTKAKSYSALPGTIFACGPRYVLLRPEFLKAAREGRMAVDSKIVTICMGGADPDNFTLRSLQELVPKLPSDWKVQIIVGAAFRFREVLEDWLSACKNAHEVFTNLTAAALVQVMSGSRAVICSASTMASEVACVGAGLYLRKTTENQTGVYHFFLDHELALRHHDFEPEQRMDRMLERQKVFFDGLTGTRIFHLIQGLQDAHKVSLRRARVADCALYFAWTNDPVTRQSSFSTDPISYEEHVRWFEKKREDPSEHLLIAEIESRPLGQIRFTCKDDEALLSFSLAPDQRGQGLGLHLVRLGIRKLKSEYQQIDRFVGFVKRENLASCEIFRKLGFSEQDAKEYPNAIRFEYGGN